ncbi:hypothetical protein ACFWM7_01565 [Streptomyces sp. NPDC058375]|uniref:hypothetical protein n=1 Tax=Streptomyces sp. NPDC058375 TaxID=3346467 RepID=UPI003656FD8F
MKITKGARVSGSITNNYVGHLEFTGTVVDMYQSGGRLAVNVACDDGVERTALADRLTPGPAKLTPNMVRSLRNLVRHESVCAEGTQAMNDAGCTYPALEALVRRGLAEVVGTGQQCARFDGGTYEPRVYRATDSGRRANDLHCG